MDVSKIYLSLKTVSLIVKLRDQKWIDYYFLAMLKEKKSAFIVRHFKEIFMNNRSLSHMTIIP